ncbi:MAG: ABC transporter permease [Saprospiraceae bacterium]|nr:ABC transporter permease [Saprospiraceae bacterium]
MKNKSYPDPPKWGRRWLRWYCPSALLEEIEGDLLEAFERNIEARGIRFARRHYIIDSIRFFNPTTFEKARSLGRRSAPFYQNHLSMFRNYLKIAVRNLWRYKENTTINLMGLTVGLTGFLLIGLFVWDEWKFDQYHPHKDRIFRVIADRTSGDGNSGYASTSPAVGPTFKQDFAEVEQTLRLFQLRQKILFDNGTDSFLEDDGFFAEGSIFDMFHLPLAHGDPTTALEKPNTVVLSTPLAQKYFGEENPVGKTMQVNNNELTVTGVLEPLLPHFHLKFDFLFSFEDLLADVSKERIQSWVWQDFYNYVRFKEGSSVEQFEAKLPAFVEEYAHPTTKKMGFHYYLDLQPLTDIHLHSSTLRNDKIVAGNYRYVTGLAYVGFFLLFIACINFINLTTAKAIRRSKEVGIRKTAGARRVQLAMQFFSEAILVVIIAMVLAANLARFILPYLNDFAGKQISFPIYTNLTVIGLLLGLCLATGLLAGAYPAMVLSGFRPLQALKNMQFRPGTRQEWLRKSLIVVQFTVSTLLIICVLIVFQQVQFLNQQDLGFQKEQLIHFPMRGSIFSKQDVVRQEFSQVPGVVSASIGFGIPGDIVSGDNIIVPGEDRQTLPARIFTIDHDYIKTMGMEVIAGRDFNKDISTDADEGFIINETAVHTLGIADSPAEAIGKPLEWEMWVQGDTIKKGRVIGVVKDFHYNSFHQVVQTSVLHIFPGAYWKVALRLDGQNMGETLAAIEEVWDSFDSGYPIDYQFVDASFGEMYVAEQKLSKIFWVFTLLAIFIACMGAFGLATYAAERRQKEIGIRKVLGASVEGIVGLLSRDFLQLVFIALLIASPIAWYFMKEWLADFAYRIDIHWWIFALAGVLALGIAFFSVSAQSLRAALANPVNALRDE